jgi:prepilin-type processing-associated H-X9-DG protein
MAGHVTRSGGTEPINYKVLPSCFSAAAYQCQDEKLRAWGSGHPGGANFVFADGATRFISDTISSITLAAISTRANGEVTGDVP